jgi:hypothetical protein
LKGLSQNQRSINSAFYSKIEIDAALENAWTVDHSLLLITLIGWLRI